MVEPEAPVRRPVFGQRSVGGLAFVDRGQAAAEQDLAAKLQLVRSLVTCVNAAGHLEPLELAFVEIEPLRLAHHGVRLEAEPLQVIPDQLVELGSRALAVGVVDPEDEGAAMFPGKQIIVQRRADVADVQPAGRRRREAGDDTHGFGPVWKKLLIG